MGNITCLEDVTPASVVAVLQIHNIEKTVLRGTTLLPLYLQ